MSCINNNNKNRDTKKQKNVPEEIPIDRLYTPEEAIEEFKVNTSVRTWVFRAKGIFAHFQSFYKQGTRHEVLKELKNFLEKKEVDNNKTRGNSKKRFYKLKTNIFLPAELKRHKYLIPPNTPEGVVYLLFSLEPETLLYMKHKSFFNDIDPKRRAFFPSKLFWPEHVGYIKFPKQVLSIRKLTGQEPTTEESSEEDYDSQDPKEINYEEEEDEDGDEGTSISKKVKGKGKVGNTVFLDMEQMNCLFDGFFEKLTTKFLPLIGEVIQTSTQKALQNYLTSQE